MSSIVYFSDLDSTSLRILTPVEGLTISEAIASILPEGTPHAIVASEEYHNLDKEYFSAYHFIDGAVTFDLEELKSIQLNKIREARTPLLSALDTAYFKALEVGDTAKMQNISSAKQILRDLPDQPLPTTPKEIMTYWPLFLTQDPGLLANDPSVISNSSSTVS